MSTEDYLIKLAEAKDQETMGKLIGLGVKDKELLPDAYEAICNIAKDKGFKFKNIQLP